MDICIWVSLYSITDWVIKHVASNYLCILTILTVVYGITVITVWGQFFTKNVNRRKARLASKIKDIERVATAETLWTALVIPVLSLATTSRKLYIVKT